jgi:uncharacterized protein (DUF305 family)
MEAESGRVAPSVLIEDGEYSDERFTDIMAAHHQAAIEMARIAERNGEHREIRELAESQISAQRREIDELSSIKEELSGGPEVASRMNPLSQTAFATLTPDELADQRPFDRAFIDSNIAHHASAIEMASVALSQSGYEGIMRLARNIVDAQAREVGRMIGWRREWYPGG